ncbi:MAG: CcmD family protein [candidate division KSB1 bacterium]|nr:CcmD family protein [candidate division KSB1 bacterium]
MNHIFFLVLAYLFLWLVLFGYIWSLLRRQKRLSEEIRLLAAEVDHRR